MVDGFDLLEFPGRAPHFGQWGIAQFVTFRLGDSLPRQVAEGELLLLGKDGDAAKRRRMEGFLDRGYGCCALGRPDVARIVQEAILHFDGERYVALAWCVMPNHVHVLIEERSPVSDVVRGWKRHVTTEARRLVRAGSLELPAGELWQRGYFDRYIRNAEHYETVLEYIHNNPVRAGLCESASEWEWSSARLPRRMPSPLVFS